MKKKTAALLITLAICFGITIGVTAAGNETITALLNRQVTVTYNGKAQSFTDAAGKAVFPITYNGTTYLPVRAVAGLVGLPVDWDAATNTVKLGQSSSGAKLSVAEYEKQMTAIEQKVSKMNDQIASEINALNLYNANDIKRFREIVAEMKGYLQELIALQAPDKYAAAQAKYKSGSEHMVKALDATLELVDMASNPSTADPAKLMELKQTMEDEMEIGSAELLEADSLIQKAAGN